MHRDEYRSSYCNYSVANIFQIENKILQVEIYERFRSKNERTEAKGYPATHVVKKEKEVVGVVKK